MPLTTSRLKKLIANAEASGVSNDEIEFLRGELKAFEDDGLSMVGDDHNLINDNGKQIYISTGPINEMEQLRLKREVLGSNQLSQRFFNYFKRKIKPSSLVRG
ncbi:hypothetical protein LC612_31465 [Nostoc sp. CHAB 5834]|nr:hypothetical protein [Nostoc sp. CHAB 5834]